MNKIKNKSKRKIKKENTSTLYLDTETSEMLKFCADRTKRSKVGILREIIVPMTEILATFKRGNYWLYQKGDSINLQFFGEKSAITLINEPINEEGEK